jgi:hypothetical protein
MPFPREARWLAALTAFALAFELTARVEDWVRYGMPLHSPYRSESDLMVRDSLGMHGRAGARYLKWQMNALGMRGPEVPAARRPQVLRVVATGASEMFGQSESPGQEFPRQLEDSLRARLPGSGLPFTDVEVLNAAFFGMSLPTITQDVALRLGGLRPDIVVLYPTTAQYLSDKPPAAAAPLAGAVPDVDPRGALKPRSATRLREQLKRLAPRPLREWLWRQEYARAVDAHGPEWRFTALPGERIESFDQDLRAFVGAVRSIGAEPVLATHANLFVGGSVADSSLLMAWQRFYPRAEGRVILEFDSAGADATRRVASDSGVALADIRSELQGCEACFADYSHFSDQGAARAADRMAGDLLTMLAARPVPARSPSVVAAGS